MKMYVFISRLLALAAVINHPPTERSDPTPSAARRESEITYKHSTAYNYVLVGGGCGGS